MNINELLENKELSWLDKVNTLTELKLGLEGKITNDIPITIDVKYKFKPNFDNLSKNDQWKELDLALKILTLTKNWDRIYNLDFTRMVSTEYFRKFFIEYINSSGWHLQTLGCNCYKNEKRVSIKTLANWGQKLYWKKIIDKNLFNKFLEFLEDLSYNN